jgi:hypothetical protein
MTAPDQPALPAALQRSIDRMDILQLFARYCHIVDDCTFERLPEVFAPDAAFDYSSLGPEVKGRRTTMQGVREFIDFLTATMDDVGPGLTHLMTNHVVDVAGDEADIVSHNTVLNLPIGGHYRSHARRTPDGWRLDRFVFSWRDYAAMTRKMGFEPAAPSTSPAVQQVRGATHG